jgi:adenylate kinase
MQKRVILITGTPATGKTTLAQKLAATLNAHYINLTDLAKKEKLITAQDTQRDTAIINETKMRRKLAAIIKTDQTDIVIDGHYAAAVTPKTQTTHIFVLRRNPTELRPLMQQRGYSKQKQDENIAAEILDVVLTETLQKHPKEKICEIDTTTKTPQETLNDVLAVLEGKKKCRIGCVDWITTLETEGKLDEYLKP